jgi:hypothetical protein
MIAVDSPPVPTTSWYCPAGHGPIPGMAVNSAPQTGTAAVASPLSCLIGNAAVTIGGVPLQSVSQGWLPAMSGSTR